MRPNPIEAREPPAAFTDRTFDGAEFIARRGDAPPPLSAILWRREALARALTTANGGDVKALVSAAATGARVAFVAEGLELS